MIVVKTESGIAKDVEPSTDEGYLKVTGISNNARVYYFLYSSLDGLEHSATESEAIFEKVVDIILDSVPPSAPAPAPEEEPVPEPEAPLLGGEDPSLEAYLAALNERHSVITDLIPERYDFVEGESGNNMGDGGNDMFDGGNFISTNH